MNKKSSFRDFCDNGGIIGFIKRNPHLWLLVYWLIYCFFFVIEEQVITNDFEGIHWIHCKLDDMIPFWKWFSIPYVIWYPYIVLPLAWLALKNPPEFKREMWFIMLTYSVTLIIYAVFPNGQNHRPPLELIQGNNPIDWWLRFLYGYDTNTNVLPSVHVIGTLAASFGLLQLKACRKWWSLLIISVFTVSICVSIVFVKQHSILDLFAALILCGIAYPIVYNKKTKEIANSSAIMPFSIKRKKKN